MYRKGRSETKRTQVFLCVSLRNLSVLCDTKKMLKELTVQVSDITGSFPKNYSL